MRISQLPIWAAAFLAFLITFAIYMAWPSYAYQPDSIQAAMAIQSDATGMQYYHPSGERLFEPGLTERISDEYQQESNIRYYLEYPTAVLVEKIRRGAGWDGLVITPLVVFRGLVGALGVLFFVLAMYQITENRLIALMSGVGLGVTASYWTFATDMYQTINGAALVAVSFYFLVRQSRAERSGLRLMDKLVLAFFLALATLYNITAVITAFAFCIGVGLIHTQGKFADRVRHFLVFGVMYSALTGLLFLGLNALLAPTTGQGNPFEWVAGDGSTQMVVEFQPAQDAFRAFLGFTKAHMIFPGISVRSFQGFRAYWDAAGTIQKILVVGFHGLVGLVAAIPVVVLYWRRRGLAADRRWLLIVLPIWFLGYAGFNWFWLPSDVHYWIVPMMIWWTVVCLVLTVIQVDWPRLYRPALVLAGAFVALTFGLNLFSQFLPESRIENNPWISVAEALRESDPDSLFISDGHPLDFPIAYFTHRNIVATNILALATNDSTEKIESVVDTQLDLHRAAGTDVYIYSSKDVEALAKLIGVSRAELEAAWEYPDLTIYRVVFPTAQPSS